MLIKKKKTSRLKKIVYNHLHRSKWNMLLAFACMLGFTFFELMAPWPIKLIFDHVLLEEPFPQILSFLDSMLYDKKAELVIIISSSIVIMSSCRGVCSYFQIFLTSRIGFQLVYTLRKDLFNHLQRLSISFHNRARSGELLTKVSSDTLALKEIFSDVMLNFVIYVFTLIGMFVIMFSINLRLSLIVLATFPVLGIILFYNLKKIRISAKKQRGKEGKVAAKVNEIMESILLVKAFGRENYEDLEFAKKSNKTMKESIQMARRRAAASRTVEIVSSFGKWSVILFGSFQVLNGHMTIGGIVIFYTYVDRMFSQIRKLVQISTKVAKAIASAERISKVLQIELEIQDFPSAIEAKDLRGEILFKTVCFNYENGKDALKNISFHVNSGEMIALVGGSGAGKSTIASLILRFHDPKEGSVLIDGIDIKEYNRESLRHNTGVVLQDLVLFGATVYENITYGKPNATILEVEKAAKQAHAHEFIMALPDGYNTELAERGNTISVGQRQRICLARAIIKCPSILILDEPTSSVDNESESLIYNTINSVQRGKTTIVITHRFSNMNRFDQILVLKDGAIVERGTHDELMDLKGYYCGLAQTQGK